MSQSAVPVILLEDDPTLRLLMSDALDEAGYRVVEAATGQAGLAAIAAAAGNAILVADRSIDGGGPNGFQLAADALQQHPALRVIYVSGTHIAVRRRVLSERERGLLKPFAMAQLVSTVRELARVNAA